MEIIESEKETNKANIVELPLNFIEVGNIDRDSVHVYIKQDVYKRIEKLAKEDISKEVGSILLGDYTDDSNRKTVIISSYIEAKYTDASASTLTFTHDTWDYVYSEKEKKDKDLKIIGWQHTHPGYGIFLSNYDIFIQENFFNLPWQIAYVVDPIANERGFFEWNYKKVSKMSGFYVYDEVGKKIVIEEKNKKKIKLSVSNIVLSALLCISVLAAISFGIEKNNLTRLLNDTFTKQTELNNKIAESDDSVIRDKNNIIENDEIAKFIVYEIKPGDNLEFICKKYNIDYMDNISTILRIN
ncbi:MAG: metal-dependent protease of the PAD1/JAB1 superfamily, partial [Clostridiales bacterium]|nr:metal-dependent protease of the PAD1/JAB1 superfamily [Clostridiales bacterium]